VASVVFELASVTWCRPRAPLRSTLPCPWPRFRRTTLAGLIATADSATGGGGGAVSTVKVVVLFTPL
jgi:hypothetical protein